MPGILVVEDDENLNRGITFSLKKSGYEVFSAESVKKAKRIASDNNVDVTICDVNLPDGNGLEFVRWMRCNYNTYIICLTALDQEMDQVMGYEAGADDYITKPFSLSVLLLKIEAHFRRRQEKTEAGKMISGDIVFIAGEMKVLIKSREISLTKTELKMLTFLLYWKKKEDACHQKILDQLEGILIRFRENKFDALLKTENPAELEKLNDQLEAIGHHIQLLKEEAREEKESTKEMVSDISHQLKTPVAALDTCFSVLMQNDLSATEQEEFRIRCRGALDGLETLLQSLLEISKMETGLIQINKKKLPLMDTVISAVNRTYPKADEKEIEFVFDYEKELETCTIMQDKRWLGEAVINVLDNAVKYSPCGSKIFIRLQKRNDLVRMEIEDQGIGIPQNEYHKIFQRFYRGSSKEVMEKSGTGIGLFLSREIIEKHAGTITVTSGKKKKGSTFVIQLPYVG